MHPPQKAQMKLNSFTIKFGIFYCWKLQEIYSRNIVSAKTVRNLITAVIEHGSWNELIEKLLSWYEANSQVTTAH